MVEDAFVPTFDEGLLKPHNQKIYKKIIRNFKTHSRTLIVQATGTGKSYLALKFLSDFAHKKKVLFVAPTDVILDKFSENLGKNITNKDISLTTATYAGLKKHAKKHYDIIVFDEVHRSGAEKWGESVKEVLASHPEAMVLGMTATLERDDGVDVCETFGVPWPVSQLSLVEAVEQGILPSPDYTLAKVDFSADKEFFDSAKDRIEDGIKRSADKSKRARLVDYLTKIGKAQKLIEEPSIIPQVLQSELNKKPNLKNGKFIVFVEPGYFGESDDYGEVDKRILEMVEQQAKESWFETPPTTYKVHSTFGKKHNQKTINEFEHSNQPGVKLLFSVNMLNEGLHVDDIDGVIMLRSTQSKTIYLQQLGRALSVGKGKQPKVFDFVANLDYTGLKKMLAKTQNQEITSLQKDEQDRKKQKDDEIETVFPIDYVNYDKQQFLDGLKQNIIQEFARTDKKVVDEIIYQMRAYLNSPDYLNLSEIERIAIDTSTYNVPSKYRMPNGFALYGFLVRVGLGVNDPEDKYAIIPNEEQKKELEKLGVCFDKKSLQEKIAYKTAIYEQSAPEYLVFDNKDEMKVYEIIQNLKQYLNSPDYLNLSERERIAIDVSTYNVPKRYKMPNGLDLYNFLHRVGKGVDNPGHEDAIIPNEEQKKELESLGVCFDRQAYDKKRVNCIIQQLKQYLSSQDYLSLSERKRITIDANAYNVPSEYKMPNGFDLYSFLTKVGLGVSNPEDKRAIIPNEEQKKELESLGVCFDDDALNKKRVDSIIQQLKQYLSSPDYLDLSEEERIAIDTSTYNIPSPSKYKMPNGFDLYKYLILINRGVNNPQKENAIIPTSEQKAELESLGVCFDEETLEAKRKRVKAKYAADADEGEEKPTNRS